MSENDDKLIEQARLLVQRLERISVDSIWARRASGLRGALLRWIELYDMGNTELTAGDAAHIDTLIKIGFQFLERAAHERFR